MTSAPMSASSMPHVGPAMICASSTTLMPCNGPMLRSLLRRAADEVIVDEARGLHECVHDRGADEREVAALEVLRERVGLRRRGRHGGHGARAIALGPAVDEAPDVAVEAAEFLLDGEE